jgi:hypothetical protein
MGMTICLAEDTGPTGLGLLFHSIQLWPGSRGLMLAFLKRRITTINAQYFVLNRLAKAVNPIPTNQMTGIHTLKAPQATLRNCCSIVALKDPRDDEKKERSVRLQ